MVDTNTAKTHIVLGAGVIGLSIGYYLAKSNHHVTVIEQTEIACSASGKSGGFLARDWQDNSATEDLCRRSYELHQQLANELNGTVTYDYRTCNTYSIAVDQVSNNNARKQQKPHKTKLPSWIDGHIKSVRQIGTTDDTAQITPYKFCHTLANEIKRLGGTVIIDTVKHIDVQKNTVSSVILQSGQTIPCQSFTIAAGSWSSNTLLQSTFHTLPTFTGNKAHSIILQPNDKNNNIYKQIDNTMLFLDYTDIHRKSTDPEIYPRADGSIYICGVSDPTLLPNTAVDVVSNDLSAQSLYQVGCSVSSIIQQHYHIDTAQACYLPTCNDGLPVIGQLIEYSNVYICSSHTCWGMNNSLGSGIAVAQLITTGKTEIDISELLPSRLS